MTLNHALLIGAGAVGSLYGAVLTKAGLKISVLSERNAAEIEENGIKIDSHMGEFFLKPQSVISSINDLDFRPDLVIFATKLVSSFDVSRYSVSFVRRRSYFTDSKWYLYRAFISKIF